MTTLLNSRDLDNRPMPSASPDFDAAIIGAGPYGLSAAAHLIHAGLAVRVFGQPMEFWADKMPAGMLLRSPREASSLSGPGQGSTLEAYETATGKKPSAPVSLSTFVDYGRWFQQRLVPNLDRTGVARVIRQNSVFRLTLQDGSSVTSRRVVVAAGIGPFRRKPAPFAHLPAELASHCYEGRRIAEFAGKAVAVIGAGQSALESAALLHEAGARVHVITRIPRLRWIGAHSWLHHLGPISKMLYSKYDVGPLGISRLVSYPSLMFPVPLKIKDKIRTRAVRPAGSRWLPPRLEKVKVSTGCAVSSADPNGDKVRLKLDDGSSCEVDHVLMGTGYSVDLSQEHRWLPGRPLLQPQRLSP